MEEDTGLEYGLLGPVQVGFVFVAGMLLDLDYAASVGDPRCHAHICERKPS